MAGYCSCGKAHPDLGIYRNQACGQPLEYIRLQEWAPNNPFRKSDSALLCGVCDKPGTYCLPASFG